MFAVIETGSKQYRVEPGTKIQVEKLAPTKDGKVVFDRVLLIEQGGEVRVGTPYLGNVVEGTAKDIRGERKMVFRFHSKTRYRKKKTHRQPLTEVVITKI